MGLFNWQEVFRKIGQFPDMIPFRGGKRIATLFIAFEYNLNEIAKSSLRRKRLEMLLRQARVIKTCDE
jgi:hypothetical protein